MKVTLRSALAIGALLALSGLNATGQSFTSPVGTWDLLVSGSGQKGIVFMTFSEDATNRNQGTFSGYQLVSAKPRTTSSSYNGRNPGGDVGRYISIDTNAPFTAGTNLLGFTPVSGPWWYDEKGRVVGYFTVAGGFHEPVTNITLIFDDTGTNIVGGTTNIDIGGFTNAFSYMAKVVPGKRLNLACSTSSGKITYRGVPYKTMIPGIGGSWYGTKKENRQEFLQEFDLTSYAISGVDPAEGIGDDVTNYANIYSCTDWGTGPGYQFGARVMVSTRKKIAFNFYTFPEGVTNTPMIYQTKQGVTFGPLRRAKKAAKANTRGFEEPSPGTSLSVPIKFKGAQKPLY